MRKYSKLLAALLTGSLIAGMVPAMAFAEALEEEEVVMKDSLCCCGVSPTL